MVLEKIPEGKEINTGNVTFSFIEEPFVDVCEYSGGRIVSDMRYIKAKRNGAINTAYARKSVADRLVTASSLLPGGYRLMIYDAWRPYSVQKSIYDEYYSSLEQMPENRGLTEDELHRMTRKFVSFPLMGEELSYVHSSGGAIDLTLCNEAGEELDMGCGFDDFTPVAATSALEGTDCPARENRRLLYTVMTMAGFTNYKDEWWHFDYGDAFWASVTGSPAIYRSVYRKEEVENE